VWAWHERGGQIEFGVYVDGVPQKPITLRGKIIELLDDLTLGARGNEPVLLDGFWLYTRAIGETEARARAAAPTQEGPASRYAGDVILKKPRPFAPYSAVN